MHCTTDASALHPVSPCTLVLSALLCISASVLLAPFFTDTYTTKPQQDKMWGRSSATSMPDGHCLLPAQYRMWRDFRDITYVGPRSLDKIVVSLILMR